MKRNRRNYYRILHVQPEAPVEIIRASYRTLMGPLRQHPDRGGEHETAALLNEAYAVLSDPARRAAYDRSMRKEQMRAPPPVSAGGAPAEDAADWRDRRCCPFCRGALPAGARSGTICGRCGAPLARPPRPDARMRELFGKRATRRYPRRTEVELTPSFGAAPHRALLVDLSLTGIGLIAAIPLGDARVFRVTGAGVDAVATVVASKRRRDGVSIHARLLTLRLEPDAGAFVSARA